jgi:flagellar hook assembly protein FlgD
MTDVMIAAFGTDQDNEIYVMSYDGKIYKLAASAASVAATSPDENALSLMSAPNPFTTLTHFTYDLPYSANVELVIYDALGRKIKTLIDGRQEAGANFVTWDGSSDFDAPLVNGSYLCRLTVDNQFVKTTQVVVQR